MSVRKSQSRFQNFIDLPVIHPAKSGLSLLSSPVTINISENALFQQQEMKPTAAHLSFTRAQPNAGAESLFSTPFLCARGWKWILSLRCTQRERRGRIYEPAA
jgi:hypothetical protein